MNLELHKCYECAYKFFASFPMEVISILGVRTFQCQYFLNISSICHSHTKNIKDKIVIYFDVNVLVVKPSLKKVKSLIQSNYYIGYATNTTSMNRR